MEAIFDDETNGIARIRVNDLIFTIFHDIEDVAIGIEIVGGDDCIDMPDFKELVNEIDRVISLLDTRENKP